MAMFDNLMMSNSCFCSGPMSSTSVARSNRVLAQHLLQMTSEDFVT